MTPPPPHTHPSTTSSPNTPDLSSPIFGAVPFPPHIQSFRPHQWDTINAIDELFNAGSSVVFLQAPTGSGKTFIAEALRRLRGEKALYVCTTKQLQDQFSEDWAGQGNVKVVKGRSNYLTASGPLDEYGNPLSPSAFGSVSAVTCADCNYTSPERPCTWCPPPARCPYRTAVNDALLADVACLNTSYLLTDANLGAGHFHARDLVILDEADLLERELMGMVDVRISPRNMAKFGLEPPRFKTETAKKNDWVEWAGYAVDRIQDYIEDNFPAEIRSAPLQRQKEYKRVRQLHEKLMHLHGQLPEKGWVLDDVDNGGVTFKPVNVAKYGQQLLWSHGRRFLVMSATILSAELMASELGLQRSYSFVEMPSTIPKANRKVYVTPVAAMTNKTKAWDYPRMAESIGKVIAEHPESRILVHTVSYERARYFHHACSNDDRVPSDRPLLVYLSGREKDQVVEEYKKTPNAVIFAASLDRGVDLPGDLCRVQIITKVPFPNLGDKQVNARANGSLGGQLWYKTQAIRTIIQMCGRAVRGPEDYAETYILDAMFKDNLMKDGHLLPRYFREALIFREDLLPDRTGK